MLLNLTKADIKSRQTRECLSSVKLRTPEWLGDDSVGRKSILDSILLHHHKFQQPIITHLDLNMYSRTNLPGYSKPGATDEENLLKTAMDYLMPGLVSLKLPVAATSSILDCVKEKGRLLFFNLTPRLVAYFLFCKHLGVSQNCKSLP